MIRLPNVATPEAAATVSVPERTPADGFVPIAIVTSPVNPVATLSNASYAVTTTGGAMGEPAIASGGCTVNRTCVGAAARTDRDSAPVIVGVAASVARSWRMPAVRNVTPAGNDRTPASAAWNS